MLISSRIERIRENHAKIVGSFTAKDCANHASRSYQFEVDGKIYHGRGNSAAGGNCDNVRIGAPIFVHYETGNPTNNLGSDPVSELWDHIIPMILVVLFFPPLLIWRYFRWRACGSPWHWNWS